MKQKGFLLVLILLLHSGSVWSQDSTASSDENLYLRIYKPGKSGFVIAQDSKKIKILYQDSLIQGTFSIVDRNTIQINGVQIPIKEIEKIGVNRNRRIIASAIALSSGTIGLIRFIILDIQEAPYFSATILTAPFTLPMISIGTINLAHKRRYNLERNWSIQIIEE